jgi:MFS family permease
MVVEVFTMRSDRRHQTNIAISSWTVACIEWYDFFVYGTAAALVFPAAFFPSNAPLVGTLLSFTTFGVGFIARPLGGLVFGHIGDTVFNAFRRNSTVRSQRIIGRTQCAIHASC